MPILELCLLVVTMAGVLLGGWSVCWARVSRSPGRIAWGRRLFVLALLGLGSCAVVAAGCWAEALAPLGLSAVLLVVAMVWEGPAPASRGREE